MKVTEAEIRDMSTSERGELFGVLRRVMEENEELYDDLPEESEEELQLLNERLEEYKKDPSSAISWEEAYEKLKKRDDKF